MGERVVLVLDVDGVLLDPTRRGLGPWLDDAAVRFAVDADEIHLFFRTRWDAVIVGKAPLADALATHFVENGIAADADEFIQHWLETDFVLDESVVAIAQHWAERGVPLFLATNQEHMRAAFLRDRLAPLPISDVFYSADLGVGKPDPEFFALAQARLRSLYPDAGIVFVDDALANVAAARDHGWTAIHYSGQATLGDEVAAAIAGSGRTTPG